MENELLFIAVMESANWDRHNDTQPISQIHHSQFCKSVPNSISTIAIRPTCLNCLKTFAENVINMSKRKRRKWKIFKNRLADKHTIRNTISLSIDHIFQHNFIHAVLIAWVCYAFCGVKTHTWMHFSIFRWNQPFGHFCLKLILMKPVCSVIFIIHAKGLSFLATQTFPNLIQVFQIQCFRVFNGFILKKHNLQISSHESMLYFWSGRETFLCSFE